MTAKEFLRKIYLLVETSRPQFYFVPVYFYVASFVILESAITLPVLVQAATLSFPLTLFINGVNDLYDTDTDELDDLRKEGETVEEKYGDLRTLKVALSISPLIILTVSFVFNLWNSLFVMLMVAFGYAYSAPPFRFKERPPLDSLSNGAIAVILPFLAGAVIFTNPTDIPLVTIGKALALTFGIAAAHAYYAAIDYEPDKEAGLNTVATKYGKGFCVAVAVLAVLLNYVAFMRELGLYFDIIVGYILLLLLSTFRKMEPKYMLRMAHLIYPGFILGVILFLFLDSGGVHVNIQQIGLEFTVGGGG